MSSKNNAIYLWYFVYGFAIIAFLSALYSYKQKDNVMGVDNNTLFKISKCVFLWSIALGVYISFNDSFTITE